MCTWVAYTGSENAAPLLWEAGRKIEGLWSGVFTGLATLDNGRIYHGKMRGTTLDWEKRFALADFPGQTGLWHSRTGGYGDDDRAHPFVSSDGEVALISQGFPGVFAGKAQQAFIRYGEMLMNEGWKFSSAKTDDLSGKYPTLFGKYSVHVSEIAAMTVAYFYRQGLKPLAAVQKTFTELPEEAGSVVIFRQHPGKLFYATTNQSVVAARCGSGMMMSVSVLAFPTDNFLQMPVNSCGMISADEILIRKLSDRYTVDETIPDDLDAVFLETLAEIQPNGIAGVCDAGLKKLFPQGVMQCCQISTYRTAERLLKAKKITARTYIEKKDNWRRTVFSKNSAN